MNAEELRQMLYRRIETADSPDGRRDGCEALRYFEEGEQYRVESQLQSQSVIAVPGFTDQVMERVLDRRMIPPDRIDLIHWSFEELQTPHTERLKPGRYELVLRRLPDKAGQE